MDGKFHLGLLPENRSFRSPLPVGTEKKFPASRDYPRASYLYAELRNIAAMNLVLPPHHEVSLSLRTFSHPPCTFLKGCSTGIMEPVSAFRKPMERLQVPVEMTVYRSQTNSSQNGIVDAT
jgi:hypothetical protein